MTLEKENEELSRKNRELKRVESTKQGEITQFTEQNTQLTKANVALKLENSKLRKHNALKRVHDWCVQSFDHIDASRVASLQATCTSQEESILRLQNALDGCSSVIMRCMGCSDVEARMILRNVRDVINVEESWESKLEYSKEKLSNGRLKTRRLETEVAKLRGLLLDSSGHFTKMDHVPLDLHNASGRASTAGRKLYLELLYVGVPPSAVASSVALFMAHSKQRIRCPMPLKDYFVKLNRALMPLNTIVFS